MARNSVRVDPPVVKFKDINVGQRYGMKVTAANVGKTTKKILMEKPASKLFKLPSGKAEMVAPGLSVGGVLEFIPEKNEEVRDCLNVHVDDRETIEIPLLGIPKACSLLMDSVVNFGCTAANSQVIIRHHAITNEGSLPGYFHVQYSGDPSVTISPCSGVILPGGTTWLKVELCTDKPRLLVEKAIVKLQNHPAVLSIRAEVVDQCLELFDLQGAPLSHLSFGPLHFGTSSTKNVVLRNSGPLACDWLCVLQLNAAGTEVGTDLQKRTEAALLEEMEKCSSFPQDSFPCLLCVPEQGRLAPYEQTTVAVRFSPLSNSSTGESGFRQDYCLFLLFESVGSKHGFTNHIGKSNVELAVTGTGLPVVLVPHPSHDFDFGHCIEGQQVNLPCVLQNFCPLFPVKFRFRKLAHFSTEPSTGKIPPGQCQDVVLSFDARRTGRLKVHQKLDVLGLVQRDGNQQTEDITPLKLGCIHTITLNLSAVCCSQTVQLPPKLNPGLTPQVTNPAGQRPNVCYSELSRCYTMVHAAVLRADKTQLHEHQRKSQNTNEKVFLAFPNDRATSLRPADADTEYRTIFTGVRRYHYIDTTFAFTEEEEKQRQQHKQIYMNFLSRRRQTYLQKIKESKQDKITDVDLGMIPAYGLVPPTLHIKDIQVNEFSDSRQCHSTVFSGTRKSFQDSSVTPKLLHSAKENSAIPSSSQEVADCSRTLTPQELYQVDIGPLFVDFGEVCLQSVCHQKVEMTNNLSVFVWVQLEVDCSDLQVSSPLSYVLPPHSQNSLLLMFQSSKLGRFYRTMCYTINKQHFGQIVVQAQVVPLALELSTPLLVLFPISTMLATSEYRSFITIRNQRNHAAEFSWKRIVTGNRNLFSVQPTTGTVEPYSELDCEVVWHPSFSAPPEGDFDLWVYEGTAQHLHCVAKIASTVVQLEETQMSMKSVPLNMDFTKIAMVHNTGPNHTYYKVPDVCPLPGMVVSPSEGVIPCGGNAALSIHLKADSVIKFDTRIEIALRNMKSIEVRVVGSVEPPKLDISMSHFQFNGVHAGSRRAIPFTLTNGSSAATQVTFDFSDYTDFSLQLARPSAVTQPGLSVIEIQSMKTMDCFLIFSPTQAATYDFEMPMKISGVRWSAASLSSTPSTSSTSASLSARGSIHVVKHMPITMATLQIPCIQATALCAPLEMSPSTLEFHIENLTKQSDDYIIKKTVTLKALGEESMYWHSCLKEVNWWFNCPAPTVSTEDKREGVLCTVSPSSGSLRRGQAICLEVRVRPNALKKRTGQVTTTTLSLPLYIGGDWMDEKENEPYRELFITITFQSPFITFQPPQILFIPVPLENKVTATLTLHASGYPRGTNVSAEVDEVEREDGMKIQPVSVVFPNGNIIPPKPLDESQPVSVWNERPRETSLICTVTFCSSKPLSLCTHLTFIDHLQNRFRIRLCANTESCLLTVWPFLALNHSQQKIVFQPGLTAVEVVPQSQHRSTPVSGLSSSLFDHSISTCSSVSDTSDSDRLSNRTSRNTIPSTSKNLGFPTFPAENSEEGIYYEKVLLAMKRWFSFFGWPGGPHPISVPHTLRRVVSKIQVNIGGQQSQRVTLSRDTRSVLNMVHHLTGHQVPGISRFQTFSCDLTERTRELLQQNEAVLTFLRVQGAFLCHIRPAFLLDIQEFKHWCSLQLNEEENSFDYSCVDYESLSKRSWTDVLLQIYKVLVLSRVSQSNMNNSFDHKIIDEILQFSPQSLPSNIYSCRELQLLSWVNMHYQSSRETLWKKDGGPLARWIVNFDLDFKDGLVLAALLAAYCPYLMHSHFRRIYMRPSSTEQTTHNNIIVCQALTTLNLNFDIQLTDLCSPNPVQILILCVHLHERLPQYFPQHTVVLSGGLHTTFYKQVRLENPSPKPVKYQACLFGATAHLFSLPNGPLVTVPSASSAGLTILYHCSFIQPKEAYLLLVSSSPFGLQGSTLAFKLTTCINRITSTNIVKCKSSCYQMKVIQVPISNALNKEATFRVMLVESEFNPLESIEKRKPGVHDVTFKANIEKMASDKSYREIDDKNSAISNEASDFHSAVRSIFLTSEQEDTLNIHYLPFFPGTKYCSVLLVCPEVGDMVYVIKATGELPLPSTLTARPSKNIFMVDSTSVFRLQCEIGQVCEEVVQVPEINSAWENALAIWGQYGMSAEEQRRRTLTHSLDSSSVRAKAATHKLLKQIISLRNELRNGIEYKVEVSLPQYYVLPSVVYIPVNKDTGIPQQSLADRCCVDIPLQFQADCVGQFRCQLVLSSCFDIRVYEIEAIVTAQKETIHLNFNSAVHHSVTQDIPLCNETQRDWKIQAVMCGEGFSGPKFVNVPSGTKTFYPLTFHPLAQCVVMGKLALNNECNGNVSVFILRGVGEHPLPEDHAMLHCPVGQTTHTQLNVPNYSQKKLTVKVETDLPIVSGTPFLELGPGQNTPYVLSVTPWKQGKQTGFLSFQQIDDMQEEDKDTDILGHYMVYFFVEIFCEPAAPVRIIDVQCVSGSSVDIEIPVSNPGKEALKLNVYLEGDDLSGQSWVLISPQDTFIYRATYSPISMGKWTGSVLFRSKLVGEFWYQLHLYALPPPVLILPQIYCPLGKWTRQTIPFVNPTAESLQLLVRNTNPRNYTVEMDSENTLTLEPHSFTQVAVHFRPSSIGQGNRISKMTFSCPQLQEWCVVLTGCGLNPERMEPVSISSLMGSSTSITIPFTNPTELPVMVDVTLTDKDPSGAAGSQVITDIKVFSIPLSHMDGILVSEGGSFDVPVVFRPNNAVLKQAWLSVTMTHVCSNGLASTETERAEVDLTAVCWNYHLFGIPVDQTARLGVVCCEAGQKVERTVDIQLAGYIPWSCKQMGQEDFQVSAEDFVCTVQSDSKAETEDCLSASVTAGRRDPETSLITLTLHIVYTPLKTCRRSVFLVVHCISGTIWKCPIDLIATEPHKDNAIIIESTEVGKTSAVGIRLTSTTRRSVQFSAAFLPGSSRDFRVTPSSGFLPPVGSAGKLITVSFTPTSANSKHTARLTIQAVLMQQTFEVKGTVLQSPPIYITSDNGNTYAPRPSKEKKSFVVQNLRIPNLANSSPLKLRR
ncbi:cilia- and flagella-associated protein 47-like [Takifugu flavidus]|uniref:cilia- and flagella-associated protein 47-like n=1 Tax=Takifugu flavidus TaxID=433684 RepID=UPI0025445C36|nr:cilia- and flagella-associated protein 47-like [Takifugu flavidus]